jgi:UDP-N-acetylglucosamine acyltransferase
MSTAIHPSAVVSPKARLGQNVTVGPYAVIEEDVTIGDGTTIGPHAFISRWTTLGRDCRIFHGAAIGGPPQDLKYKNEPTTLEVGDRTTLREFVTLNRGTVSSGKTTVGSDCLIMAYAHVAHDCRVGNQVIIANCSALAGHVTIEDWVIVGGLTPIHQFVRIGSHSLVGGGVRVPKDVPPYVLASRSPVVFEGLNVVGLRRRGFTAATIALIDKAYRFLYRSNLNVSQALARIKEEVELVPEIKALVDFVSSSKRGIISAHTTHT